MYVKQLLNGQRQQRSQQRQHITATLPTWVKNKQFYRLNDAKRITEVEEQEGKNWVQASLVDAAAEADGLEL